MALRCVVMIEKVPGAVHHQERDQPATLVAPRPKVTAFHIVT